MLEGLEPKQILFIVTYCACIYDVIIITESWLVDSIVDSELFDSRYMVWRRDRNYSFTEQVKGGGVLIATRRELCVTPQSIFHSTAEDLWLTVSFGTCSGFMKLNICVLYLCQQKNGLSFSQQLYNYCTQLNKIVLTYSDDRYLVVGDFKIPGSG